MIRSPLEHSENFRLTYAPWLEAGNGLPEASTDSLFASVVEHWRDDGLVGLVFSGRPFCGGSDWSNRSQSTLFKRNHLLKANASIAYPECVKRLQSCYLSSFAAEDPNFVRCLELQTPFVYQLSGKARTLFANHGVHGILHWPRQRFNSPTWCGAFLLLFDRPIDDTWFENQELDNTLHYLHLTLVEKDRRRFNPYIQLGLFKPTALKVLRLVSAGYPSREVAKRVNLSERGVEYHLECLKQKLNANNRVHLIHIAHQFELV